MAKPTVQPEAASFDTYRLGVRGMCFTVSTDPRSGDWPRHRARSNPWRISYEPRVPAAQESLWPYLGLRRADRYLANTRGVLVKQIRLAPVDPRAHRIMRKAAYFD